MLSLIHAQPLLEHNEAEQDFVIVFSPGSMRFQKILNGFGLEQRKHERALVQKHFWKLAFEGRIEPLVDHVHSKPAFLTFQNALWKVIATDPAVQPFPR